MCNGSLKLWDDGFSQIFSKNISKYKLQNLDSDKTGRPPNSIKKWRDNTYLII